MTPVDLDAARKTAREAQERAEKATPGPWGDRRVGQKGNGLPRSHEEQICGSDEIGALIVAHDGGDDGHANVDFVCAARSDVPDLAAMVLAMAEELERLRKDLETLATERDAALAGEADLECSLERLRGDAETLVEVAHERDAAFAEVARQNAEQADLRPIALRAVEWAEGNSGSSGRLVAALRAAGLLK